MRRQIPGWSVPMLGLFGWTALSAPAVAQDLDKLLRKADIKCAGDLEKRHQNPPAWDFTTNSRRPIPQEPTVYLHCVFNNDPKNVIEVNWLIPQLKQPIPGNSSALSPKYSDEAPLGNPEGCLVFGNLRDKSLKAQFWARQRDKDALSEEAGKDCLALKTTSVRPAAAKAEKLADINAPFRIFLRIAFGQQPAFAAFEGITGVRSMGAGRYESFVTYRLRGTDQSVPSPELSGVYTLRPRWSGPVEALAKSFFEKNKDPVPLLVSKEPTTIAFAVSGSGNWSLHELEYIVRDRDGNVAGSLFSPVYVSLP